MAAPSTLPDFSPVNNSAMSEPLSPRRGVLTLFGFGISVRVDRGHLVVEDGIGPYRRHGRFPRVGHGLRRLVVVGSDGVISLAAIRWLIDQKAAFVNLNRNGTVLVASGPTGPRDARLRRAQALAQSSGAALPLARDLIARKLAGQEENVRRVFDDDAALKAIGAARERVASASTIADIRTLEAQAALAYWGCWRMLPVMFPKVDLPRVPQHWRSFGARISPLTGSPRLSVNPTNAMLNYLYAVLESEARLAAAALGLDPGLGLMHMDTNVRDSLACDLMEPVRPTTVDAYVLNWLIHQPLKREWFFEAPNGHCRLVDSFAERLSATAPTWAQAVAPIAERVAKALWTTIRKSDRNRSPATRLTEQHRRDAKGQSLKPIAPPRTPPRLCRTCGAAMPYGETQCRTCWDKSLSERMLPIAAKGRILSQTPVAQARRAETRRRQMAAQRTWKPSDQPEWLTETVYIEQIQPRLAKISASKLASALGVSAPYAVDIRAGRCRPHPRHWRVLAQLVGVTS
jgi:CRISPR-associated endonuclease Cas1